MNAAEILVAVQQAGAALRVEGDLPVASECQPHCASNQGVHPGAQATAHCRLLAPPVPGCDFPVTGLRYRRTYAHLQLRPTALVEVGRWRQ